METYTDHGNAERFVSMHRDRIRWVPGLGWKTWDGTRWDALEGDIPYDLVVDLIERVTAEAENVVGAVHRQMAQRAALKLRSEKTISAMLRLAKAHPRLKQAADDFDKQPNLLNCSDGVLDLDTGKLTAHDPELLLTKMTAVPYTGAGGCPMWEGHIQTILDFRRPLMAYVHRALGYTLSGYTDEQVLFVAVGSGANGKSVLLNVVRDVMGSYWSNADKNLLLKSQANAIGHNLVQLKGARFVTSIETGEGNTLDEVAVKQLTGSDAVTGRLLYKNNITFIPSAKIWLSTNHVPKVGSQDHGTWRRLKPIPFMVVIPEGSRIKGYDKQMFEAEGPAILRWLVAGYRRWKKVGLKEPEDVRASMVEYQTSEDAYRLVDFVGAKCNSGANYAQTTDTEMYEAYTAWLGEIDDDDVVRLSKKELMRKLTAFGARATRWMDGDVERRGVTGLYLNGHGDPNFDPEVEEMLAAHERANSN